MKVTDIELFPIRLKAIKRGYRTEHAGGFPSLSTVIVRVNTDAGICGLGEATSGTAYFNQNDRAPHPTTLTSATNSRCRWPSVRSMEPR